MDNSSEMEREVFLAMSPPRRVPETIRAVAASWKDTLAQGAISTVFLLFGLLICWLLLPSHPLRNWQLDHEPSRTVAGTILAVKRTNTKINGSRLFDYEFSYPAGDLRKTGEFSTTGRGWRQGEPVPVRYLTGRPEIAEVVGTRWGGKSPWMLLLLLVPVAGIYSLFTVFRERTGKLRLLREGWLGSAIVVSVKDLRGRGQRQFWYKTNLSLAGDGRSVSRRGRSEKELALLQLKRETGEPVTILYDPTKPKRMLFPESWVAMIPVSARIILSEIGGVSVRDRVPAMSREMGEFLAMPPPRIVPRSIAKTFSRNSALWPLMVFGGLLIAFSLLVFCVSFQNNKGIGSLVALVSLLIGSLMLFGSIHFGRRKKWLLRNGVRGTATVMLVERTSVEINHRPQFKIHLMRGDEGVALRKRSCDVSEIALAARKMESGDPVILLCDPQNPKLFLLPEAADF